MYPYKSKIKLGQVALYVNNLELQTKYYTEAIGFTVKKSSPEEVLLGFEGSDQEILRLIKTDKERVKNYGLYHIAILVNDRVQLANSLYHLIKNKAIIEGASDHGYSEALYVRDPENNGIEIYCDRDESVWDIREDGKIEGVTEELQADELLTHVDTREGFRFNKYTTMGHVHLQSRYALESSELYRELFPLEDKSSMPTGSWIASGGYHHHLAFNHWAGHNLAKRQDKEPGLAYFTMIFEDQEVYQESISKAKEKLYLVEETESYYLFEDQDGIRTRLEFEK
ncbi:MAG: VOC family protein [Gemella sp.]|nr:VOC family protein [Gemella sp.]